METLLKLISAKRRGDEEGWSLTSTLVTVVLTLVVGAVVVGLITSATRGSSQFSDSVMTESELNNAMSSMGRQLTTAESISVGDNDLMRVKSTDNGKKVSTAFMAWTPDSWDKFKQYLSGNSTYGDDLSASDMPKFPAVVSATTVYGDDGKPVDGKPNVRVLVNGFVKSDDQPLFTYFDKNDDTISPVPLTDDKLPTVKRVQVQLNATVEGREAPMQLATSVSPRGLSGLQKDSSYVDVKEAPASPKLTGSLPPRTSTSTLSWNNVDGADSYTIYRENRNQASNPMVIGTTTKTTITDTKVAWGETYIYYVIASNVNGISPSSNRLSLTATPPAPKLVGKINTDNTNALTWNLTNGATGYRLIRDGKNITTINMTSGSPSYKDAAVKAGETHTYKVVAFNSAGTGKDDALGNGDSPWSNEVTLYANPKAPHLEGDVNKGDRNLEWTAVTGATGYELKRISPSGKSFPVQTGRTYSDKDKIVSKTFTYQVRAKNPSGYSDWSNVVTLNPNPDPVQPKVYDYTDSSSSYNGKNKTTWPASAEATSYDWRIGGTDGAFTSVGNVLSYWDTNPGADSNRSYDVRACNYTGCSTHKWDWGKQPPGTFSVNNYMDNSRLGYKSKRSSGDHGGSDISARDLSPEWARFYWTGSSGADQYTGKLGSKTLLSNGNSSARNFTAKEGTYSPGGTYAVNVTAKGNTSGLSRTSKLNWQATPAQPDNIAFRFQYIDKGSSSSEISRLQAWADKSDGRRGYTSSKGSADSVELRYGYRANKNDGNYSFKAVGDTWNKWTVSRYTQSFKYRDIKTDHEERGGIAWGRSYKSLAKGYTGSSYSQDSKTSRGWWNTDKQHDSEFNGGYRGIFGGTTKGRGTPWEGKNGVGVASQTSSWKAVPWSQANFYYAGVSGSGCNKNCANYWEIESR